MTSTELFATATAVSVPADTQDPVLAMIDLLITSAASQPHPASVDRRPRPALTGALGNLPWRQSEWIGILPDREYQAVLANYLASAASSIIVCMFHIALGAATAPLVDALVTAHQRGVNVRVLIDRDRPTDPYNSIVVNSHARRYLKDRGVLVRRDAPEQLLHSKYLVIDGSLVIIGSHNWSAGSFAVFDDMSLAIHSLPLAGDMTARFESSWSAATE